MIEIDEVPEYAGLIYVLPKSEHITKDGKYCSGFYVVKTAPKIHTTKYTDEELKLTDKFYYNMLTARKKSQEEKQRRLFIEGTVEKIPYSELLEKYEKLKKQVKMMDIENKKLDMLVGEFSETMQQDRRIIRAYQAKMKESDPNFNIIDFEDQFLE